MRFVFLLLLFFPLLITAQLQVAKIFTENMVLQRDKPVRVWGKGLPGKKVEVFFANDKRETTVKNDSAWRIEFGKQEANTITQSIIIRSGDDMIELKNILIGDVWVCLGQSNMEWPMIKEIHFREEIVNSNDPLIRLYNPTYAGKNTFNISFTDSIVQNLTHEKFYKGQWLSCDSNSFKTMSAVGYYFAKKIIENEKIPLGLINLSIGGAPLESFISADALKGSKRFSDKVKGDWLVNSALPVWVKERGRQNVGGISNLSDDEFGKNHAFKPSFAYKSGIEPILNMPVKGIIFYQGESNAQEIERINEYRELFELMVTDYRKKWLQPQMPVYYVQLSSIDSLKYRSQLWPEFRNEQRRIMDMILYSGMAVCSDIGFKDDVHPTNKKDVGERLARWALNKTYKRNIIPSGPLPQIAKYTNGKIIIVFQYAGIKLITSDGRPVRGFSVDGKNDCKASIQNNTVVISVRERPSFVYYGWKPFTDGNLVNSEKLPASTFKISIQ